MKLIICIILTFTLGCMTAPDAKRLSNTDNQVKSINEEIRQ